MKWNSTLYDKKHDFVAEYGKGLLEFVPQNPKQSILDLGCGTGTLTAQLAELCNKLVGVDSSQNMIEKAKEEFGNIEFKVCDALALPFEKEFDVVFPMLYFTGSVTTMLCWKIYIRLGSIGVRVWCKWKYCND